MRFTDKVAVITAFANGIGRATAEIMVREGAVVVGVDNHPGRLETAAAALRGAGGRAHARLCDALDPGQVAATVASVEKEFGAVGITINAIAPSLTLTERIRPHWDRRAREAQEAEIERTPLRRVAEAADQAKVICFLASNDADFVTGITIDVTGGN